MSYWLLFEMLEMARQQKAYEQEKNVPEDWLETATGFYERLAVFFEAKGIEQQLERMKSVFEYALENPTYLKHATSVRDTIKNKAKEFRSDERASEHFELLDKVIAM